MLWNKITCKKSIGEKILKKDRDGYYSFDFNNIIPMPEEIKQLQGTDDYKKYEEWCYKNWGTNDNACHTRIAVRGDEFKIEFYTDSMIPRKIITEYAKLCSDAEFHYEHMDEFDPIEGHHILHKIGDQIIG